MSKSSDRLDKIEFNISEILRILQEQFSIKNYSKGKKTNKDNQKGIGVVTTDHEGNIISKKVG